MALLLLLVLATVQVSNAERLAPASWTDGTHFSGVFTDHAVLQRAPQKAALYGVVIDHSGALSETTAVAVTLSDATTSKTYNMTAQHIELVNNTYARWKAVLEPMAAGGNYTITASCPKCSGNATNSSSLKDIVFGDVWFCSGQSNM